MQLSVYCVAIPPRLPHARRFLAAMGMEGAIILPPVLRDTLSHADLVRSKLVSPEYPSSHDFMGKIACSLSHAQTLRHFLASDAEVALVFEDDNQIPSPAAAAEARTTIDKLLALREWQFINLVSCDANCSMWRSTLARVGPHRVNRASGVGTPAYLVRREGAKEFLRVMFPLTNAKVALDERIPDLAHAYEVHPRLFEPGDAAKSTNGNYDAVPECRKGFDVRNLGTYGLVSGMVIALVAAVVLLGRRRAEGAERAATRGGRDGR